MHRVRTWGVVLFLSAGLASGLLAVPVGSGNSSIITDRSAFLPNRKHGPLSSKVIGVLVAEPATILKLEGRTGPKDQICFSTGLKSYRWMYVPVSRNPKVGSLNVPVGTKGELKQFGNLSMASPEALSEYGVTATYALVEVEVNGGAGSPAVESFVATRITRLDGTKEYPLKLSEIIDKVRKGYDQRVRDLQRDLDAAMEASRATALKDKNPTGPRRRVDVMYVTWVPETERLRVHVRSTLSDGDYKYAGGVKIELGPRTDSLPEGLRYGKQFGVEFGVAYEYSKSGNLERTLTLPPASYSRDILPPPVFDKGR